MQFHTHSQPDDDPTNLLSRQRFGRSRETWNINVRQNIKTFNIAQQNIQRSTLNINSISRYIICELKSRRWVDYDDTEHTIKVHQRKDDIVLMRVSESTQKGFFTSKSISTRLMMRKKGEAALWWVREVDSGGEEKKRQKHYVSNSLSRHIVCALSSMEENCVNWFFFLLFCLLHIKHIRDVTMSNDRRPTSEKRRFFVNIYFWWWTFLSVERAASKISTSVWQTTSK